MKVIAVKSKIRYLCPELLKKKSQWTWLAGCVLISIQVIFLSKFMIKVEFD